MSAAKWKRQKSIQRSIILLALSFTLLAAAVIIALSARTVHTRLQRSAVQSAEYALDTAVTAMRSNIDEVDQLADWCVANPEIRSWLLSGGTASQTQTVHTTLSGKYNSMRTAPYIQHFIVLSSSGGFMNFGAMSSQVTRPLVDAGLRAALPGFTGQGNTSWQAIITDPLVLANRASPSLPVVRSLSGSDGHAGNVYIGVAPTLLTDPLRGFNLAEGGMLYLQIGDAVYTMKEGKLVLTETPDGMRSRDSDDAGTLNPQTQLFESADGDILAVSMPLGVHGLYLSEAIPRASLGKLTLSMLIQPALAGLAVIFALGVVLALVLHRMVAEPVMALQRRTERVSAGDFSPDTSLNWNNELGDISRSINRMAQSISEMLRKQREDEEEKRELEYGILQSQINPHFIYNTLNSIKWMATMQHNTGIAEMTTALSRLLKSVSKGNEKLVTLGEELKLLADYFLIQQYRYGGTITLNVRGPEDKALYDSFLIPRFTLQPLVENAIFHGIEPRAQAGEILLRIDAQPDGSMLLRLSDNGIGMTQAQIERALSEPAPGEAEAKYRHVGIWNVHRRLQYSFGAEWGLRIESTPGAGTTIFIRLPRQEGGGQA